jgi:L-ascorbate metabolism protein UlaG (beta-lactamase superfamily)
MPSRYENQDPRHAPHGVADVFRWSVLDRLTGRRRVAPPGLPAPRVPIDPDAIHRKDGAARVTWIGHASFLATLGGASFLVDPVFSKRIGRFIPRHGEPGLLATDLPPLAALLVTHNHYDHLDAPSLRSLPRELPVFTAAGLGPWFCRRGFANVNEMSWWDAATAGPLTISFVPARHWSRRGIGDTNRSAWGGFVVSGGGTTLYHAGDTGWFDGFRAIAARFPAIDLALLPIGAYAPAWFMEPHHMNPEQAIDAIEVLGARAMAPMHWGAFRLTDEPLTEPIERLRRAWEARRPAARLQVLSVGETVAVA